MTEWIKCADQMPEERKTVLFFDQWDTGDDRVKCGWWSGRWWTPNAELDGDGCLSVYGPKGVTHWMPIPKLPVTD